MIYTALYLILNTLKDSFMECLKISLNIIIYINTIDKNKNKKILGYDYYVDNLLIRLIYNPLNQ